ncbi:hypothetical protein B9Z55_012942 [Caenorhabditis nigoni]|uniref:Uncharacterized protein n=1 Tax=Caenorhabditis nigoni TaxID=1611254 RepID=A0A2G5U0H7_9PELO|nr:hypothetical protein B9Z55_012942 [Caenorhabditis nigoni]
MHTTAYELHKNIWKNRIETLKVAVPAVVYAIQNNLYYTALANIDPTTYSVTLQLRILTTAALSVCLLNKKLSWYQWGAQVMALIGVATVQLDKSNSHKEVAGTYWIGVAAVIGMCWTSAFAGVYFEKMLKNSSADVWMQNIRLSILTLIFAGITMMTTDGEAVVQGRMFEGWSQMVWLVTILNSIGGLCISLVMKYADNVMKTYCQSIAIGLTSLVSIFLGERLLTLHLIFGVLLVTSSVVVYSLFPATPPTLSAYHKLEQQEDELLISSDDVEDEEDQIFGAVGEEKCYEADPCTNISRPANELLKNIWKTRIEALEVAVPAVVNAIQNNLYYIALANIDPTTYSVTLQLRILTTAALSVCLLNRKLSWFQWGAQVMALIGVATVQLDKSNSHKEVAGTYWIGVAAVIGMCWTSAFAGVYFEKMLKTSSADVWMQNIRLSILTLIFAGITMMTTDGEAVVQGRMFEGWSQMVWLVTILNSIGGLCISLVMKYADNVMKTYCQSIAIGLTSLVSIFLGERLLTLHLIFGVLLVTSSVVVYSLFPATPPTLSAYHKLEQQEDELLISSDDVEDEEDQIFGAVGEEKVAALSI